MISEMAWHQIVLLMRPSPLAAAAVPSSRALNRRARRSTRFEPIS